jgi:hypothetical protein
MQIYKDMNLCHQEEDMNIKTESVFFFVTTEPCDEIGGRSQIFGTRASHQQPASYAALRADYKVLFVSVGKTAVSLKFYFATKKGRR